MSKSDFQVTKSTGERARFSLNKLRASLQRSGADPKTIQQILDVVRDDLYQGISTQEIHDRAFELLQKKKPASASKYKLKRALFELGPTGFPFEKFIAALFVESGFKTEVGVVLPGKCVDHEVDVVLRDGEEMETVECKFHSDKMRYCNVKVPLYIQARYMDILKHDREHGQKPPRKAWVVTNTRFTADARRFGECSGLSLLGWNYPKGNSLQDRIDRLRLYPITVSTLLSSTEKEQLLENGVVHCKQLIDESWHLSHLQISESRQERILEELKNLCDHE